MESWSLIQEFILPGINVNMFVLYCNILYIIHEVDYALVYYFPFYQPKSV